MVAAFSPKAASVQRRHRAAVFPRNNMHIQPVSSVSFLITDRRKDAVRRDEVVRRRDSDGGVAGI